MAPWQEPPHEEGSPSLNKVLRKHQVGRIRGGPARGRLRRCRLTAGAGARAGVAVLAVEDDVVAAAERLTGFDEVRAGGALVGRRRGRQQGGESEKGAGQNELDQSLLHVVTSLKAMAVRADGRRQDTRSRRKSEADPHRSDFRMTRFGIGKRNPKTEAWTICLPVLRFPAPGRKDLRSMKKNLV